MWAKATGATPTTVPILSGVELPAVNVRDGGTLITAIVPQKLVAKSGKFPLVLQDKASGKISNEIEFVVK